MAAKTYPKKELRQVMLSTVIACAGCGQATGINERLLADGENYYHQRCAPTGEAPVVHTLELSDDLKVKSE